MSHVLIDRNTLTSEPVGLIKIGADPVETAGWVEGERVLMIEEGEIEVEGNLLCDDGYWMIRPDWSTVRELDISPPDDPAIARG